MYFPSTSDQNLNAVPDNNGPKKGGGAFKQSMVVVAYLQSLRVFFRLAGQAAPVSIFIHPLIFFKTPFRSTFVVYGLLKLQFYKPHFNYRVWQIITPRRWVHQPCLMDPDCGEKTNFWTNYSEYYNFRSCHQNHHSCASFRQVVTILYYSFPQQDR